jgi:hypothetical protein
MLTGILKVRNKPRRYEEEAVHIRDVNRWCLKAIVMVVGSSRDIYVRIHLKCEMAWDLYWC